MRINITTLLTICLTAMLAMPLAAQDRTNISVSDFDQISMGRSGTVYVTQGNETKVEVVASEEVLEDLDIEVKGSELIIKNKSRNWNMRSGKLEVYVITPEIKGLSVSGSGKLVVQNKINVGNLRMAVSGSGKIICGMNAGNLNIAISGSGNAELSGTCKELNGAISGSGGIRGEELRTDKVDMTISGSGSCEIHVNESIEARISGSGSIRYSGNPQHVNSKSSGSGSVKKVG